MKKAVLFSSLMLFALSFNACKKCQTCTTTTQQNYNGYEQNTNTTNEYCGDDYDDAPEEGTYVQNVGGVNQEVVIECSEN